jgi:hypothetical protein
MGRSIWGGDVYAQVQEEVIPVAEVDRTHWGKIETEADDEPQAEAAEPGAAGGEAGEEAGA